MNRLPLRLACLLVCLAPGPCPAAGPPAAVDPVEFFETKVRPVLAEHCFKCHAAAAAKPKGGLLLDNRAALLRGGDSGPALVPGHPEKSRLIEAVSYQNPDLRMPPRGRLPAAAVADLSAWVSRGAPWPAGPAPASVAPAPQGLNLRERKRSHWAWQPVRVPAIPAVKDPGWPRGPIDRFILAGLEAHGLAPAPPAERHALLRRVWFDLAGLPPPPAELDAFLADRAPDALEHVVDRLLASPHFGERWARHWLDLVRYAETRGHEFDFPAPNAHQYRDYVVRALNADLPYDRFVTEHLAGDLVDPPRLHPTAGFNESVLGTGFWFLGEALHSPVDLRQDEADRLDNMLDVMTKTFLSLTVACARCHDHKFDAISTRDYYALSGFLRGSRYRLVRFDSVEPNRRVAAELGALRERGRPALQRAQAEAMRPAVGRVADYLLAAREASLAGACRGPACPQDLEDIARARRLDPAALARWMDHLARATHDAHDPLHAWAVLASDPAAASPRRPAGLPEPVLADFQVVVDYARGRAGDWIADGFAFGLGPVRPGDLRLGTDPAWPVVRVFDRAAAEKDPAWDRLSLAPDAETDPGALGAVVRSGRTLHTPSFDVTTGKVYYLVRGTGQAYAAVCSHGLISGPLHGQLVKPLRTAGGFQWVEHDLTAYRGYPAHVEFTPTGAGDFAVASVVQAARPPAELSNRALARALADAPGDAPEALAAAYQRVLADALERWAADRIVGSADAAEYAGLADWMVRRPELFAPGDGPVAEHVRAVARPALATEADQVARIRTGSRLAMAMLDGTGRDAPVFIRGSPKAPGPVVPRRFLEALAGPEPLPVTHGSGRLELARQLTDPALNPLLARVMVNRVWHHLFGRGIVPSVDNFGVLGEPPSHPELFDYLADRFVREGWSVKRLVRALVLSSSYRMAARPDARADAADPQDRLLHRMPVRRLEGEAIRDAMLAVSGRLDPRLYGRPVPVHLTPFQDGRGRPDDGPIDGDGRRSLYVAVRRNFLSPMMLAFDTPVPFSTVGRRSVSNVPAHALILLNDEFVHRQADLWARRILGLAVPPRDRVVAMYREAFARPPTEAELAVCLDFVGRPAAPDARGPDDLAAWADLAHVLFNAKEFIFLE
jgi:hypothetical protein